MISIFVLLDIEWITAEDEKREITQIAALRVNDAWKAVDRYGAVLCPAAFEFCDPAHMAFSGYPAEVFASGEKEPDAIRRFTEWLRDDDELCVWHHHAVDVLSAAWQEVFRAHLPRPVLCAGPRVCRAVRNGRGRSESLYAIAGALGVPVCMPHCSADDAELMRRVFTAVGLSRKRLRREAVQTAQTHSRAERNRAILARTPYQYIYLPGSPVFHTRNCPCILRARKIEGSVYYRTAAKNRRPCKVCRPEPDIQAAVLSASAPEPKAAGKAAKSAADGGDLIRAKLLGGAVIEVRRRNIIGFCHNLTHPGKLTRAILEAHQCLDKQCPFLERYEDAPFWLERRKRQCARIRAKQHRKEKKRLLQTEAETMLALRDGFQRQADRTGSSINVVRIEHPDSHTYRVFYVSDNRFADGDCFPAFLEAVRERYGPCRIILRHIRDLDGHFVTREEFRARKR